MTAERLPGTVIPRRYDLRLELELPADSFAGSETIMLSVEEPTRSIRLHAARLDIASACASDLSGNRLDARIVPFPQQEQVAFEFPADLAKGDWVLAIEFSGRLAQDLHGLYRCEWHDRTSHVMAVTQFEPTYARRAFPCLDEPALKAVFSPTLVVPEGLACISNTGVASEEPAGQGKRAIRFRDSVPLSTYTVAFVVGELQATPPVMVGQTPVRVWCVPGKLHMASYGLRVAAFVLDYLARCLGVPYPGDKLDLIAIPDFASGAMENFGAVTFRETALLVDEARATQGDLLRVASVVAHELAHMWFGNLVTMRWWDDLWLNEAFATFMETHAVDAWQPGWRHWDRFVAQRTAPLFQDGLGSTRPIAFPVEASSDCEAMFDGITYDKGAAVLRMFEQHLGSAHFFLAIGLYLARHKFGVVGRGDLVDALREVCGASVAEAFEDWVTKAGYPLVTISAGDGSLAQRRFLYLGAPSPSESWRIPMGLRGVARGVPFEMTFMMDTNKTDAPIPAHPDFVVVNAHGHGFYRVAYSQDLLQAALSALASLEPTERLCLLSDAFALALAGEIGLDQYFEMTRFFEAEEDRNIWTVLIDSFACLRRAVHEEGLAFVEAIVRSRLSRLLGILGWNASEGESEARRALRGDLIRAAGTIGNDTEVQARAREVVQREQDFDKEVVAAAVPVVAHSGGNKEYDLFEHRAFSSDSPHEAQRYLFSLAGFTSPELISRTLALCLSPRVRVQDAPYLLRAMLVSRASRRMAFEFLQSHLENVLASWPSNTVRRMLEGLAWLAEPDLQEDVKAILQRVDLGARVREQYLERLQLILRVREDLRQLAG